MVSLVSGTSHDISDRMVEYWIRMSRPTPSFFHSNRGPYAVRLTANAGGRRSVVTVRARRL